MFGLKDNSVHNDVNYNIGFVEKLHVTIKVRKLRFEMLPEALRK